MKYALRQFRTELTSPNPRQSQRAALEAGDLLELHDHPRTVSNWPDYYYDVIRPELLARPLTPQELDDLVNFLNQVVRGSLDGKSSRGAHTVGLLNAIGRAKPSIAAPLLIDILLQYHGSLIESEVHQIVHALDEMLFRERAEPRFEPLIEAFARRGLVPILREISAVSPRYENLCMPEDARSILDLMTQD